MPKSPRKRIADEGRELQGRKPRSSPRRDAQFVALRLARLLVQHQFDGIADEAEDQERQEGDGQHDAGRIQQSLGEEFEHRDP